ncbi:putative lipid II flippase FtsW [Microbacterium laevaniformans]|uniref:Probable peptidoglycan glycosyltransferase FtsW n=1 Tax=Microbacterium laevaniformans TaxID=36807 RepID=A0A4S2DAI4_9MICO|nr:putative lipid II flippase FtsW [Microbacterium laevaniformans]TGY37693.1 putative lipid II flippase FtsW [Microbacterium laevaniformans]
MTTTTPPTRPAADGPDDAATSGFAARVSLGRVFAPVSSEFLLVASTALLLTGFGLMMVLSATMASAMAAGQSPFEVVMKQAIFAVIGIPLMFIASRLPVTFWKRIAWPALIAATCFQMLVFVPGLGVANDGNQNWIQIGGIQAQPSEFLKLALALWLGYVLFRKQTLLGSWAHVFIPVVPVGGLVIGLVAVGSEDLGTGMILMAILLGCLFFSGVKLRIFIIPLIVVVVSAVFFAVTNSNRMARIMSSFVNFDSMDCYNAAVGDCYQAVHGVWALANGGLFGLGLGNSREKYGWLPARSNDYIFAILGEELGLVGCAVVLLLFTVFAIAAFQIIRKTRDPFIRIVTGGIIVWIVGQALVNIGVVLRLLPVLGVPLPFMSQGGTSLLSVLFACGVLLSFARTIPVGPASTAVAAEPLPRRR